MSAGTPSIITNTVLRVLADTATARKRHNEMIHLSFMINQFFKVVNLGAKVGINIGVNKGVKEIFLFLKGMEGDDRSLFG